MKNKKKISNTFYKIFIHFAISQLPIQYLIMYIFMYMLMSKDVNVHCNQRSEKIYLRIRNRHRLHVIGKRGRYRLLGGKNDMFIRRIVRYLFTFYRSSPVYDQ